MPWVIAGGGTSVTLTLSTSDEAPTSILVTRSEPTSGTLQTWSLEYKRWDDADWTLFANDLTALTQTVPDLVAYDPETDPDPLVTPLYTFRAVGSVLIDTPAATATGSTTEAPPTPLRTVWQSSAIAARLSDGMLANVGTAPLNGAIPAQGRTLGSKLVPLRIVTTTPRYYGLKLLLGNRRANPISGGRLIGGFTAYNGTGPSQVIGTNPQTGYVRFAIGGDIDLPIPAAPVEGGLATAWTDTLRFPGGINIRSGSNGWALFDWRFFQPETTAETDYALTWSAWGVESYTRVSTLRGECDGVNYLTGGARKTGLSFTDGDLVNTPAAAGTWFSSPPASGLAYFGPPGPEAHPILAAFWYTEEVPA